MAYYGNLALRPERKPQQQAQPVKQRERVIRRRQLPMGEKLLYLFTLALFVIVAGVVLFRYAQIYQVNREIQEINRKYEQTTVQIKELQREVERLSDPGRINKKATEMGMVPLDPEGIRVGENGTAVAMNSKK
ncbi:cell division protein FtsL [Cohnella pontilimi]|uniref:Cell division protein FtsL n=1 Tax=Cohnella pontilimi TaxID=2564100 RepID=A0A4U0FEZ6_9BACL|nr:cell division protein FtsL [Cohnella pontilimi]TJY43380.1 cell division protein FtsL [Cohnella pontilimi]